MKDGVPTCDNCQKGEELWPVRGSDPNQYICCPKSSDDYIVVGVVDGKCCGGYTKFSGSELTEIGDKLEVNGTATYKILKNKRSYCAQSSWSTHLSFDSEGHPTGYCTGTWNLVYYGTNKWCEEIDHTKCGDSSTLKNCRCSDDGDSRNGYECE